MEKLIKKILQQNKISKQLLIWFILISLLPLGIVTSLVYFISSTTGRKDNLDKLVVIADSKVHRIESYIRAKKNNVAALSQFPNIAEAIEKYEAALSYGIKSSEYEGINQEFKPLFKNYLDRLGYENVFLLSQSKELLFSLKKNDFSAYSKEEVSFKHPGVGRVYDLSKTLMQVELSNYEYDRETNQPTIFIASPVFKNKLIIGVIVFQIDNRELYRVLNDYTGLGETGETLLGLTRNNKIVFIAPTRHDPDAAFERSLPLTQENISPLQQATQGTTGKGTYRDYRNLETIAAWRYLPSFNAGIVVKIDRSEAMAAVITNRNIIISLGMTTFILTVVAAIVASRSISSPLVELTKTAKNIAAGEWDRTIKIKREDEIGELALSFNSMARELKESFEKLEQRVKERTAELRKAVEEARAAERVKDRFIANVSHELRTPLNSILGYTKMVQKESQLQPKQEDKLKIVQQSGNHLLTLINDILDLSKTEADRLEIYFRELHLQSFLDGVVAIVRMWAIEKKIEFSYQYRDLPESIQSDEKRLRQVLIDLLSNAVKFTDRGKVILQVSGRPAENPTEISFEVIDTGIGLSPERLEKIFEPFEGLKQGEYKYEGMGVSLSVSKNIVKSLGGELQVESELGKGSRFWFDLPSQVTDIPQKADLAAIGAAATTQEDRPPTPAAEEILSEKVAVLEKLPPPSEIVKISSEKLSSDKQRISGYEGQKRKILIVDDKEENIELLLDMLEPYGFDLVSAYDGQEMLDIAPTVLPDLILLDLFMPVKTGFTSAKELREIPEFKNIPIIVLSASFATEEWSEYLECDAFLNKPIDEDRLLEKLQQYLHLKWIYE